MQPILTVLELNIFQKKFKKIVGNKNIMTNVYIIQSYGAIMCGCFCIGFIAFALKSQSLLDYTNLFSTK